MRGGRKLAGDLADAGLENTGCEGRAWVWHGGHAGGRVWQLTLLQLREEIIASGLATADEVDTALALCADPALRFMSPITMAAWGVPATIAKPTDLRRARRVQKNCSIQRAWRR